MNRVARRPKILALAAVLVLVALAAAVFQQAFAAESFKAGSIASQRTLASMSDDTVVLGADEGIEAAESTMSFAELRKIARATVRVQPRVAKDGWKSEVKAGKTAGTLGTRTLRAFKVRLTSMKHVSGSIKYRTYDTGKGWGKVAKDGASSLRPSKTVQAVKIWLTGSVAEHFDVKYRVYIKGKGWQAWKKNKAKAGSTKYRARITAIKVKLVRKPVDHMDGIDIASWQAGLDPARVDADFIIVKATEGTWYVNPYFKKWAEGTLDAGKMLGLYHFINTEDPVAQADFFVKKVGKYVGKSVLFLDWENRPGSDVLSKGPAFAKKFLDRVYKKTGVRPLIYMSKSVCWNYDWTKVAKNYKLWVAQYAYKYIKLGTGYLREPWTDAYGYGAWKSPTLFQYTSNGWISGYSAGLDLDIFYGTEQDWRALQESDK